MNMGNDWRNRLAGLSLRWTRKTMTFAVMAALFAVALAVSGNGGRSVAGDGEGAQTATKVSAADVSDATGTQPEGRDSIGKSDGKSGRESGARTREAENQEAANAQTVLRFDGALKGLEVETDENGELVGSESDGALWYRITDSRFGSYRQFTRAVRGLMSREQADEFLSEANRYLITRDDGLYFVIGENGRTVETCKNYVLDGGAKIRVSAVHTAGASQRYGVSRSNAEFVKSHGVWKLTALTVF